VSNRNVCCPSESIGDFAATASTVSAARTRDPPHHTHTKTVSGNPANRAIARRCLIIVNFLSRLIRAREGAFVTTAVTFTFCKCYGSEVLILGLM
jgi:hypothetical protein